MEAVPSHVAAGKASVLSFQRSRREAGAQEVAGRGGDNLNSCPCESLIIYRYVTKKGDFKNMVDAAKTDVIIIGAGPCGLFAVLGLVCSTFAAISSISSTSTAGSAPSCI